MRQLAIEANNFDLKPAVITMVKQHRFTGHPSEDPNEHMARFMRMSNIVKLNGVRPEVIKLHLNGVKYSQAKLDALMNKMENQDKRMHSAHELGTVDDSEKGNSAKKGLTQEGPYQVEEAQYLNANISYNFKPNLNLQSHYTPTLRNHENFSYGGGAQQG